MMARSTNTETTMKHLTIDSYDQIIDTCRRLVPGATISPTVPDRDFVVQHGNARLRIWWWVGDGEANWAFELFRGDSPQPEDRSYLETVEDVTSTLYQAFGPVVLPAVLVAMLAADAAPGPEPSIMDAARAVLRLPNDGPWGLGDPRGEMRSAVWKAAEARGLHCSNVLMLAAASMVTSGLGRWWRRPVVEPGHWDGKDDLV